MTSLVQHLVPVAEVGVQQVSYKSVELQVQSLIRKSVSNRLGLLPILTFTTGRTLAFTSIATTLLLQTAIAYISVNFAQLRIAFWGSFTTPAASAGKL